MRAAPAILLASLLAAGPAQGASVNTMRDLERSDRLDTALLRVDEMEHLGKRVPDVQVITADGARSLHELMAGKPTILLLAYYSCGHTCPATIRSLADLQLDEARDDYQVVILSFDPADELAGMQGVAGSLDGVPDNWTFGILPEGENVRLTESVGFRYFFSERDQLYVHPAVLIFLSPEAEVMRYLYGAQPRASDVELALIESRNRAPRLNEFVDMLKLTCFQFDSSRSRYVLHPTIIFGTAGFALLGLVGLTTLASRKTSRGTT